MNVAKPEVDRRLDGFKAACKHAGVKLTHQRLEFFRELAACLEHPDAETGTKTRLFLVCQQGIKNLTDRSPGLPFRLMTAEQEMALFETTARAMGVAPKEIEIRHIGYCLKADPAYGEGVAKALSITMSEVARSR